MPEYDLIVVGAGPSGLIAANTWLELHPEDEVLVLESDSQLGGVWSPSRVFPSMITESSVESFEFSCYPMQPSPQNETLHGLRRAEDIFSYLEEFATYKIFAGKTIKDRIIFESPVRFIDKIFNFWNIETTQGQSFFTTKLIMATGLSPNIPNILTESLKPPIIHSRNLTAHTSSLSTPNIKSVLVLGADKSAFDTISLLRSFPTPPTIYWVIQTKGQRPAFHITPEAPWPFHKSHKLLSTRLLSKLSPCIFEPPDSWTKFWHSSKIGIWLADRIWKTIDSKWGHGFRHERNGNMNHPEPDPPAFWSSERTIVNPQAMWGTVSRTTILHDDIEGLDATEVVLRSGKRMNCDAIIATTGWLNSYPMFSDELSIALGLPLPTTRANPEDTAEWEVRTGKATERVMTTFPRLANIPRYSTHPPTSTPSRLYRLIAPIHNDEDQSIAFIGAGTVGATEPFVTAEVQALWAAAYLMREINLPSREEMKDDVALATAWRRRRYLGDGYTIGFDQLQYTSMLLRDLGLNDLRKGGGWRELLKPYKSIDYRGILEEWTAARKEKIKAG